MKRIMRATRFLVAPGVVAVALLVACGDDSGDATTTARPERVEAPAAARTAAQAEHDERLAHLKGQARTYGAPTQRQDAVRPSPIEGESRAVADQLERGAKLGGQARTYGKAASPDDPPTPVDETSDDEFVPGSRRMPTR
jgi:hypothetical protein